MEFHNTVCRQASEVKTSPSSQSSLFKYVQLMKKHENSKKSESLLTSTSNSTVFCSVHRILNIYTVHWLLLFTASRSMSHMFSFHSSASDQKHRVTTTRPHQSQKHTKGPIVAIFSVHKL